MADTNRHAAIAAILKELGINLAVKGMDARIQIQKAVYLAQVTGTDLGYRFNWYLRGPYCSQLADDYFQAANNAEALSRYQASESLKVRLKKVKAIVEECPENTLLGEWLEAVASLDYMLRVQKLSEENLESTFSKLKPHLSHLYHVALPKVKS